MTASDDYLMFMVMRMLWYKDTGTGVADTNKLIHDITNDFVNGEGNITGTIFRTNFKFGKEKKQLHQFNDRRILCSVNKNVIVFLRSIWLHG